MMHFSILKQPILVIGLFSSLYSVNAGNAHAGNTHSNNAQTSQALALVQSQSLNIPGQGVAKCRAVENDIARLACYDALFNTVLPIAVAEGAVPTVDIPTVPEVPASASELANAPAIPNAVDALSDVKVSEAPIASDISPKRAMPLAKPVEPAPPPVPLASVAEKVAENVAEKVSEKVAEKVPENAITPVSQSAEASFGAEQLVNKDPALAVTAITAKVVDINESLRGLRTFIMDNGQHWSEPESNRLRIKKGEEVVLKKGALGAYFLSKQESNRTMRVKRIK